MDDPTIDDPLSNALGGNFHNILIEQITIGERFREDYGDLQPLKDSITKYGLLQPIVVDRVNNLLAGGRRLRAITELGHKRIPAQYIDEVTPLRAREIELEENVQRKDMSLAESNKLLLAIDTLKKEIYADQVRIAIPDPKWAAENPDRERGPRAVVGWTQTDTAEYFGISPSQVSRKLALANAYQVMPELELEEVESQAFKKLDRRIEELERELTFRANSRLGRVADDARVLLGDAEELLKSIEAGSIDCVIIDPPYGVLEPGSIGRYESGVHFDDDPTLAMAKLRAVAHELKRVIKDDGHMYVFFGIKMFTETVAIFNDLGFEVDPIPLVWVKTTGSVVDWDYRFSNFYEPILFITNRTRRLSPGKHSNVLMFASVPSAERSSVAEKPLDLIKALVELSTHPQDLILDCYAGGGVVGLAAKTLNRRFILMEQNDQLWKECQNRLTRLTNEMASSTSPDPTQPQTDME